MKLSERLTELIDHKIAITVSKEDIYILWLFGRQRQYYFASD